MVCGSSQLPQGSWEAGDLRTEGGEENRGAEMSKRVTLSRPQRSSPSLDIRSKVVRGALRL